jgi:hypothetical protein
VGSISRDRNAGLVDPKSIYGDSSIKDAVETIDSNTDTLQLLQQIIYELQLINFKLNG